MRNVECVRIWEFGISFAPSTRPCPACQVRAASCELWAASAPISCAWEVLISSLVAAARTCATLRFLIFVFVSFVLGQRTGDRGQLWADNGTGHKGLLRAVALPSFRIFRVRKLKFQFNGFAGNCFWYVPLCWPLSFSWFSTMGWGARCRWRPASLSARNSSRSRRCRKSVQGDCAGDVSAIKRIASPNGC